MPGTRRHVIESSPTKVAPAPAGTQDAKPYSTLWRVMGFLQLGLVMAVAIALGMGLPRWLAGGDEVPTVQPASDEGALVGAIALSLVLGTFHLIAGVGLYWLAIGTGGFIFDYTRPVRRRLRVRRLLLSIIAQLLAFGGLAMLSSALTGPLLVLTGLPVTTAFILATMAVFIALQLLSAWFNIWTPMEAVVLRNRLLARGMWPGHLDSGVAISASDPERAKGRRLEYEHDIGMLWLLPEHLHFLGDAQDWSIPRAAVLGIERGTDSENTITYIGGRDVRVVYFDPSGTQRRIRLNPEGGCWSIAQEKRRHDWLAGQLASWLHAVPSSAMAPPEAREHGVEAVD